MLSLRSVVWTRRRHLAGQVLLDSFDLHGVPQRDTLNESGRALVRLRVQAIPEISVRYGIELPFPDEEDDPTVFQLQW